MPACDTTTASEAEARSHTGVVISGMATPPLPSGWARPGVTATPGWPSAVPRSCAPLTMVTASLSASQVAAAWVRAWRSCSESGTVDGLSAAAPKTAASASSTATALTAT